FSDDHGLRLVGNILWSELKYELNEAQGGAPTARAAPQLLERGEGWFEIYAAAYTTSANYALDEHGIEAAVAITDAGLAYARLNRLRTLENLLVLLKIDLLARAGRAAEARSLLNESQLGATGESVGWRQRDTAVHVTARILMAEGRCAEALSVLDQHAEQAEPDHHVRTRIRYRLLNAIGHHLEGRQRQALEHLELAIGLSAASGCVRGLLNERETLAPLLRSYVTLVPPPRSIEHGRALLAQIEADFAQAAPDSLLSSAERKILQELGSGFSNKLIARKVGVSESTVRFHLRNIFVKLKVRSRLQAITMARQNKLLSA
ncbi:MAG TPA: LuxR C-terminal-related transcriptional regulator, partial [Steroidobacteraceae bacterium]